MSGTLFGLGIGPGDPELLTLKAARIIGAAPVVVYPANRDGVSLAREIAGAQIAKDAIEISIPMAFDPGAGPEEAAYDRAAAQIADHLDAGRDVAVLCLGDPFFYGSFIYLFDRLRGDYPIKVVPGVSALTACAAAAAHPLARRDDSVTVLPATLPEAELERRLALCDSAAVFKIGRHLDKLITVLQRLDLAGRAIIVERASTENERVLSLAEAQASGVSYFATLIVTKPTT